MFQHMAMWTWPDAVKGETPERIVERLQAAHIDIVIPLLGAGDTPSERAEYDARIQALTEKAHRRGIIQFACPMSYFNTLRLVEMQTLECRHLMPNAHQDIWMGLGLDYITAEYFQGRRDYPEPGDTHKDAFRNDAAAIRQQLDLQVRLGQRQVVFFSHAFLTDEHIPVIAEYR